MSRRLNLVFQGGGVRGVAYAGVLEQLPTDYSIHGVGGTSVGALVAALIARGRLQELPEILRDPELQSLLVPAEQQRLQHLTAAWSDLAPLIAEMSDGSFSPLKLWRTVRKYRRLSHDLKAVWEKKGLFDVRPIRRWLRKHLGDSTFGDKLEIPDLRIMAADVSRQEYVVFSRKQHAGTTLVEAVCASTAIPIFFEPSIGLQEHYFVDGGILSNFPSFLFSDSEWPTVGLRLRDLAAPREISSPRDFLIALLLTMTEAHDKRRELSRRFTQIDVAVPDDIAATDFAKLGSNIDRLFDAGRRTRIDWEAVSSDIPSSPLPMQAGETLEVALASATELLRRSDDATLFPDRLTQTTDMTVRIDAHWSTSYEKLLTLSVPSSGALVVHPLKLRARTDVLSAVGLLELDPLFEELDAVAQPVKLPAYVRGDERGFAVVLVPPVMAGQAPRRFRAMFNVPQEFASTLGERRVDAIRSTSVQLAEHHTLGFTLQIQVHASLPSLQLSPLFACRRTESTGTIGGEEYRCYEFTAGPGVVNTRVVHEVRLERI